MECQVHFLSIFTVDNYLHHKDNTFAVVHPFVCPSIHEQDYAKSFKWFSWNLVGLWTTVVWKQIKFWGWSYSEWPTGSHFGVLLSYIMQVFGFVLAMARGMYSTESLLVVIAELSELIVYIDQYIFSWVHSFIAALCRINDGFVTVIHVYLLSSTDAVANLVYTINAMMSCRWYLIQTRSSANADGTVWVHCELK